MEVLPNRCSGKVGRRGRWLLQHLRVSPYRLLRRPIGTYDAEGKFDNNQFIVNVCQQKRELRNCGTFQIGSRQQFRKRRWSSGFAAQEPLELENVVALLEWPVWSEP